MLQKEGGEDVVRPILPEVHARMLGMTESELVPLLAELERFKVFSRTSDDILFSRRMVRDEKLRQVRASGGVKSLDHPNVPRPKAKNEFTGKASLQPPLRTSPSPSSSSSHSMKRDTAAMNQLTDAAVAEIYNNYPKRVAQRPAKEAIRHAAERVAKAENISLEAALQRLLIRVKLYRDRETAKGTDQQFIPLPATWFSQERYDDESLMRLDNAVRPGALEKLRLEAASA
ncbi:hypothetical protein ACPOL_3462 [Acidisarcina polymorpha]|uniref:Uncharacterized protein n=2 Tax=Acidisarcina polymorpha TaxID=2211140 RepID=A0A2Z5G1Y1_9BACT|nr:hypothetical protein ACPOL_3462 [Acidisarcina polymorpha]